MNESRVSLRKRLIAAIMRCATAAGSFRCALAGSTWVPRPGRRAAGVRRGGRRDTAMVHESGACARTLGFGLLVSVWGSPKRGGAGRGGGGPGGTGKRRHV